MRYSDNILIKNNIFQNNTSSSYGGSFLAINSDNYSIVGNLFDRNQGTNGGGVSLYGMGVAKSNYILFANNTVSNNFCK